MQIDFQLAERGDAPIVSRISAEAYSAAYVIIVVVPAPAYENYAHWIETGEV